MTYDDLVAIRNPAARVAELRRNAPIASVEMLSAALDDPLHSVRAVAALELRRRLTPELVELLVQQAKTPERTAATCLAFGDSQLEVAREFLVTQSSSSHADVRYEAIVALNELGTEELRDIVESRLKSDTDVGVIVVCAQICANFGWASESLKTRYDALPRGILRKNKDRFQLACALAALFAAGVELDAASRADVRRDLEDHLTGDQQSTAASQALAQLNDVEACAALAKAAKSFRLHPIHKVEAAVALTRLGDSRGIELLRAALNGRRKDARGWAIICAGKYGIDALRADVERVVEGDDYHADNGILALRLYGDDRAKDLVLRVSLDHKDPEIREFAAEVLAAWEHKDVI